MIELLLIGVLVVLALLALFVILVFNNIITLENRIENAFAQIDVQLKKRTDLVPNLVETVKGYMKHEQTAIKAVTEARAAMMGAKTTGEKLKADQGLEKALKTIFALAENYPNLKANENFLLLQNELTDIEEKIAYARQAYTDSILEFNVVITTIPGMWIAGMMGKAKKEQFKIEEEERKPVKVKFE